MNKEYTFFWKNRSPFSNWYPSVFIYDNIRFTRGEQYMMYRKAMMFGDTEIAQQILETDVPSLQKDLGREVRNYVDEQWARDRVAIMVDGLYEKFKQNEILGCILLATGNTIIAEASPYDLIWGIGFEESDPKARDETQWRGQNLLGIVLMKVRDKLNAEAI